MKNFLAMMLITCGLFSGYSFADETDAELIAANLAANTATTAAKNPEVETLKAYYALLSNQDIEAATLKEHAKDIVDENWNATPIMRGGQGLDGFATTFATYHQAIPNIKWTVQAIYKSGPKTYTVRSLVSGTPMRVDFLAIENRSILGEIEYSFKEGNSFEIMAIEIHTLKNNKIVKTFHVEDWLDAINQLTKVPQSQ